MTSGIKSRRHRMTTARVAGDLYSSTRRPRVRDNRSRSVGFEAGASKTTTTTRTAAAQSRCYTTYRSDDERRRHSDQSDTTSETSCSSGGGGVCSDDCTTTDDTMSCGTSHNAVLSLQLQMQELFIVSRCPYWLDSADGLLNLPDDLIREVFCRISLKEIVRMSCLSRSWRSEMHRLIDDDGYRQRWRTWAAFVEVFEGALYCLDDSSTSNFQLES